MEVTASFLSDGEVMRIVHSQQHDHKDWTSNFQHGSDTTTTKCADSGSSFCQASVVKEIDVIVQAICESSNEHSVLQKLCCEIHTCYFTDAEDGNDFAREYLFSALVDKLKKRCQEFGSLTDKAAKTQAINIYNFLGTFYFHILSLSWSRLLRQLESLILVASSHLLKPASSGQTSQISESLSTWLFKLGPYLNAHFPMTLNSLMDRVRDKFLDQMTTEYARHHLVMLIDCHAREWVIRFN